MNINLIAVHYSDKNKKNIQGFRFLDSDSGQVMDQPYQAVMNVVVSGKAPIKGIEYDKASNKLKGSNGAFDRYPALFNGQAFSNSLVIIYSLDDKGYVITNFMGKTCSAPTNKVVEYANKVGIANGKVVTKEGKQYISAICGSYTNKPASSDNQLIRQVKRKEESIRYAKEIMTKQAEAKHRNNSDVRYPRAITGKNSEESKLKDFDELTGLTVEQKLVATMMALKSVRPFYYAIFNTLKRVEVSSKDGVSTMAVSLDTFYFNSDFVKEKTISELLFVFMHEVCHIGMRHRVRENGREHDIWNQACDYFINRNLAVEFGLNEPGDTVEIKSNVRGGAGFYKITLPDDGLYNDQVDINKDTPESLYEELMKKANEQEQDNSNQEGNAGDSQGNDDESQGSNSSSNNSSSQNNNSDNSSNENNNENESSENGDKTQGNKQNTSKSNKEHKNNSEDQEDKGDESSLEKFANGDDYDESDECDESNTEENGSNSDKNGKEQSDRNKNSQDKNNGQGEQQDNSESQSNKKDKREGRLLGKEFRGQKIKSQSSDMVDDPNTRGMSEDQKKQLSNSLLSRAVTLQKQVGQFGGDNADFLERLVEKALAPKVNWKSLLKNKLIKASQKINTFAAPDKRFHSRGMVMPGPKALQNDELEGVKICVDTSGSISSKDIGIMFTQVEQLLKTYKAEAEVLYWDTRVRAVYPFKDIKELVATRPMGGGGTDANCVFEYFETERDYKIGKKKKPSIIIVFTDGYFGNIESKYKKYKDTIWVIHDNNNFTAPFGSKAPFKQED